MLEELGDPPQPYIYVIVATGNIYEDVVVLALWSWKWTWYLPGHSFGTGLTGLYHGSCLCTLHKGGAIAWIM